VQELIFRTDAARPPHLRQCPYWQAASARCRWRERLLGAAASAELVAEPVTHGYAGSAVDVTDRIKAQGQLQAQLAFTELLLEVMPLPLSILDTQGATCRSTRPGKSSPAAGATRWLATMPRDQLSSSEAQAHDARDAELLQRGGRVRYDASTLHRDGTRRDLAITKAAVPGADGKPAGILVAFMDVSEFRQAERATREARDAAEEASRAKTEFVANISHELRTPLQSIIGFSELGLVRSGAQPKLGGMFGDIHAAGQRMLALVNDLLDVSKIESTVGTFHLERTDVRSLVRDVLGELKPCSMRGGSPWTFSSARVRWWPRWTPHASSRWCATCWPTPSASRPSGESLVIEGDIDTDNRIHIRIADRGPGIPPAELDKIFEAFVQSSKTKDGSGGTGLGLAICRKILEAHGGEIRAENNPVCGSTFHIYLPARGFAETMPG
jgi:signal transduction histidine kinase